jgi:hypothetical protein
VGSRYKETRGQGDKEKGRKGEENFLPPFLPFSLSPTPYSPLPTPCDNVNGNSGLYLLEGTIKYVFSIP